VIAKAKRRSPAKRLGGSFAIEVGSGTDRVAAMEWQSKRLQNRHFYFQIS